MVRTFAAIFPRDKSARINHLCKLAETFLILIASVQQFLVSKFVERFPVNRSVAKFPTVIAFATQFPVSRSVVRFPIMTAFAKTFLVNNVIGFQIATFVNKFLIQSVFVPMKLATAMSSMPVLAQFKFLMK
jgi:hypothetical protein